MAVSGQTLVKGKHSADSRPAGGGAEPEPGSGPWAQAGGGGDMRPPVPGNSVSQQGWFSTAMFVLV